MRYYTDENGTVRPIGGKSKKKGSAAASVVLVGAAAVGIGGGVGGTGAAGDIASGQSVSVRTAKSQDAAKKGNRTKAWQRMGFKRLKRHVEREFRCGARSFGEVQRFFLRSPCVSLRRMLVLVGDGTNTAVVSVVWVRMSSASKAKRLKDVIDEDGSGDIKPLAGAVLRLEGVRFTGENYGSRRSGRWVTVAESEAVKGNPGADTLDGIAEVAACFPP